MTVEELARILREIDVEEISDPDYLEHETYDELDDCMKDMYIHYAEAYLKYFDMERKTG